MWIIGDEKAANKVHKEITAGAKGEQVEQVEQSRGAMMKKGGESAPVLYTSGAGLKPDAPI